VARRDEGDPDFRVRGTVAQEERGDRLEFLVRHVQSDGSDWRPMRRQSEVPTDAGQTQAR
jgi:hypothetical protein